jgi:hypothetical protein
VDTRCASSSFVSLPTLHSGMSSRRRRRKSSRQGGRGAEAALGLGFRGSEVRGPPCLANLEREKAGRSQRTCGGGGDGRGRTGGGPMTGSGGRRGCWVRKGGVDGGDGAWAWQR